MDPVVTPWLAQALVGGGLSALGGLGAVGLNYWLRDEPEEPELPRQPIIIPQRQSPVALNLPGAVRQAGQSQPQLPSVDYGRKLKELFAGYEQSPSPAATRPMPVAPGYMRLAQMMG